MKRIPIVIITLLSLSMNAMAEDALNWANGTWGVDIQNTPKDIDAKTLNELRGCKKSPVIIQTDRETLRYKAVHTGEDNFISKASILAVEKKWISLRYEGEERVMKNGEPQIWHMFFITPDKFYWIVGPGIQEDQRDGIVSVARVRCPIGNV